MPVATDKPSRSGIIVPPQWPDGFGGEGSPGDPPSSFPVSRAEIGMWVLLTAVVMLFAGLTSAYIVLRGLPSWQNITLPRLLWGNTLVLIASSVTLELARSALKRNRQSAMKLWVGASGILGLMFLVGQLLVWRQLAAAGVYLPSTLQSSFFFVLTALHGLHLLGGIVGLSIVMVAARRGRLTPARNEPLKVCATYWHFMDGIWIYLLLLLVLA